MGGIMRSVTAMSKRIICCSLLAVLLLCLPAVGRAYEQVGPKQEKFPYFDERGSIGLGIMHPSLSSQIQVNPGGSLPGTFIDFEKDFGLETGQVRFFGDLNYRVSPVSSFRLTYLEIARKSTKAIDRDIEIGDRTFSANATLDISLSTRYYLLAYRYSFVRNAFVEFGGSAGLNIADNSTSVQLNTLFTGPTASTGSSRGKDVGFIAPVPLVGLFFSAQVLPQLFLRNTFLYVDGDVGGFSFKALNYIITLDYNVSPSVSLGVGAYTNRLEVNKGAGIDGRFVTLINSPLAYARYNF